MAKEKEGKDKAAQKVKGTSKMSKDRKKDGKEDKQSQKLDSEFYEEELIRLQVELFRLQEWIIRENKKVVAIFEGRDAAGKGGVITRITQNLNPRICRVVALPKPTERERTQWYFQRYISHLPVAGEIVLFDRSWYNRAGVERVMGFCTDEEYHEFLRACPEFERMLVRSGIHLIKYWFSVDDEEQARRFHKRIHSPIKRWKFSEMDIESFKRWDDYSRAKDEMMAYTDIKQAPWYSVNSHEKRRARLNCIRHLLSLFPYTHEEPVSIELPSREIGVGYIRPPLEDQTLIPEHY